MNAGQIAGLLWTVAFWFIVVSFLVVPVLFAYWRNHEKRDAERTEEILKATRFDRSGAHEMDAL